MLQGEKPQDYVISTGETRTVKEFVEEAFSYVGLPWRKYVQISKSLFRPAEVYLLQGQSLLIRSNLGWIPKTTFRDLVKIMMEAELEKD
jgi:GDPmannose 4,6-dehydratase